MTTRVKAESLGREPRRLKKIFDLARSTSVEVAEPESLADALEQVLVFDSQMLTREDALELLRLVPRLRVLRRAWTLHFAAFGCISCRAKRVSYASGGFCNRCYARIHHRLGEALQKVPAWNERYDVALLTRKSDAAWKLLNGDE